MGDVSAPQDYALHDAVNLVPAKPMDALLGAFRDGGGLGSSPNWSCPPQGKDNLLLRYSSFVMLLTSLLLHAERCQCLGTCPVDSRIAWGPYIALVACFQTGTSRCSLPLLRVCPQAMTEIFLLPMFSRRDLRMCSLLLCYRFVKVIGLVRRPTQSCFCSSSGRSLTQVICLEYFWPKLYKPAGEMNIVHSEGREPRLVVDDSVCNTNALCHVPESYSNPT